MSGNKLMFIGGFGSRLRKIKRMSEMVLKVVGMAAA